MSETRDQSAATAPGFNPVHLASAIRRVAKIPLCALIACSSAFGASLVSGAEAGDIFSVFLAVLLLAMGAATLNSLQEIETDRQMERTRDRPLVADQLSRRFALFQSVVLVCCGLVLLYFKSHSILAPVLGVSALLLYNGVYTPLKKVSIYALVPGAICGAIPPLIGLSAAGESICSLQALLLGSLLVLWQIPHFILVQLRHSKDYLTSVHPSLLQKIPEKRLRGVAIVWICSLGIVMLLFAVSDLVSTAFQGYLVVANTFLFIGIIFSQLLRSKSRNYRLLFMSLNLMLVSHMVILAF